MSIYSGEHIKRKLLTNPSEIRFPLSLKLIISAKKLGSTGKIKSASADEKHTFEIHVLREIIELSKSAESRGRMQHVLQAR
jgi:hypothetical protein